MAEIIAVYPGTFDPITFGHLDIIKRAGKIFPKVIVAVAEDTAKHPIFTLKQRVDFAQKEVEGLKTKAEIIVMPFKGLLVDFVHKQEAKVIVRGLRAASDFEYEFQLSYMNYKIATDIETVFIPATSKGHFISSRFVKEIAKLGGSIASFVSPFIEKKLKDYYVKNS